MSSKERVETCALCGQGSAREQERVLRKVLLGHTAKYSRREFVCGACGEAYTDEEQGTANERAERHAIRRALAVIGPSEIRIARKFANATQRQMQEVLGLGRNTLARWETGQRPIPEYIKAIYRLIALNPLAADLLRDVEGAGNENEVHAGAEVIVWHFYTRAPSGTSSYKRTTFEPPSSANSNECCLEGAIGS